MQTFLSHCRIQWKEGRVGGREVREGGGKRWEICFLIPILRPQGICIVLFCKANVNPSYGPLSGHSAILCSLSLRLPPTHFQTQVWNQLNKYNPTAVSSINHLPIHLKINHISFWFFYHRKLSLPARVFSAYCIHLREKDGGFWFMIHVFTCSDLSL